MTRHTFLSMVDYSTSNGPTFEADFSLPDLPNLLAFGVDDVSAGCDNDGGSNPNKLADTTSFVPVPGAWYNDKPAGAETETEGAGGPFGHRVLGTRRGRGCVCPRR